MKQLRGHVVKVVIGSFSLAALLGIVALLAGGSFGETEGRILLTTVIVGVTSIAALCYLAAADKPFQVVGVVGGFSSLVPLALALWLTWFGEDADEVVFRIFGIGVTVSASIAQACLLLALAYDSRAVIRRLLFATLGLIGVVAVLIILPLAINNGFEDSDYWRYFGVVAILDVLGTVTVAALQKFVPDPAAQEPVWGTALDSRIAEAARARGVSKAELITQALDNLPDP